VPASEPAIELTALRKAYGSTQAVDNVDLTVRQGEIVALLGPNGAGKSTTIDILLGLSRADAGTARLFGKPSAEAIATGQVGAMLQTGGLIQQLSVRELLTMMASLYPNPTPVDEVLATADLQDIADKQASKLSGGQTQRVRFALAVVSQPSLLVLDEPTAALDVQARHQFWQTMRRFAAAGTTVVFATHYLEEADEFADRIVLMARGRIVADGSSTEIKSAVAIRTLRATLPDVPIETLTSWPGVQDGERHGETIVLRCHDSDRVLRQLLSSYELARDIEVRSAGLDEAFRLLTADELEESS
jgi:ABC-2 type transport system ATP-binding protein